MNAGGHGLKKYFLLCLRLSRRHYLPGHPFLHFVDGWTDGRMDAKSSVFVLQMTPSAWTKSRQRSGHLLRREGGADDIAKSQQVQVLKRKSKR
jgi:hypothetical protein